MRTQIRETQEHWISEGLKVRLWSLHPRYLDSKGLVALWREGLLAKKVLENKTRGYRNHPQLKRFKFSQSPVNTINNYLHYVCDEADRRGYQFDRSKLRSRILYVPKTAVQRGQITFEWHHLLKKVKFRSKEKYRIIRSVKRPRAHPVFKTVRGGIELWEIV